jgi:hypothetical protein
MRELWRRTTGLFWARPVLWLPLIVASLLAYAVDELRKGLDHWLVLTMVESRASVLSNARVPLHPSPFSLQLPIVVSVAAWFLIPCFYTAAFVITARLVRDSEITLEAAQRHLPYGRMAGFILKLLALSTCSILFFTVFAYFSARHHHFSSIWSFWSMHALTSLISLGIAALLAPIAIHLLREDQEMPTSAESLKLGIYFSLFAVFACSALKAFCDISARAHPSVHGAVNALVSLNICILTALPYIPLYIALALIAGDADAEGRTIPAS